jgi:hypothetical protein
MTRAAPFTLDEAAAALRKPKRWLQEWLRDHPLDKHGEPYYTPVGRDKLFHQNDIDRIELTLREEVKCRLNSGRRGKAKRPTSRSGGRTSEFEWKLAAELTNDPSLSSKNVSSRSVSKSMGSTPHPSLRLVQGSQHS